MYVCIYRSKPSKIKHKVSKHKKTLLLHTFLPQYIQLST